jgi:hypothetical protein|tara:strand:- start:261 stop:974 length:714 start_codon:yes stop_codon:yes gene_type:complete
MEKNRINKFVQKYNLAGLIESVKWDVEGTTLTTSFISDDKSVLGTVTTTDFDFEQGSYGVYDTTKFTKMLSVLENDINLSTTKVEGKTVSLNISDKGTSATYMLADLSVIPVVPDLKQLPAFNVNITVDSTFITRFNKAKGALADEKNFTFECKDGKGQIIIGHSNINTNRISIDVDCTCDGDVKPISFSADFLKEILNANRDAKTASLKISTDGLAHLHFELDSYISDYYLVQIQA